jgi:predicted oxidoreductase
VLGSPQVSRTPNILIECISFQRLCTSLSKRHKNARLKTFLLEHGYVMESVDKSLCTLNHGIDFLLV